MIYLLIKLFFCFDRNADFLHAKEREKKENNNDERRVLEENFCSLKYALRFIDIKTNDRTVSPDKSVKIIASFTSNVIHYI